MKPTKLLILPLILSSLVMGCATTNNPDQQLQQRLQLTQQVIDRYQIDTNWWTIYGDNELNKLIELALTNNIDFAQSAINVNRALYQANLIGEDLVPSFSGGTSGSASKNIKHGGDSNRNVSGNLSLSYELDLWQKIADTASAKEWEYKATVQDLETARLSLINSVVDAYYQLVYLNEAIIVTEQSIKNYQQINELVSFKYQYGKVSALDPAQATQSVLSANNNLIDLKNQQKTAEQTLRNLLNLKPEDKLTINYPSLLGLTLPEVDLNVPLSVLANRPDLKAAEYRLEEASLNKQATDKSWYPTITLGAAINSSSDKVNTAFNVPFASGNVSIDLPFLQWNKVRWNIKLSEAEYESVRLSFEQSLTTALNEVDTYYYSYSRTKDTLANTEEKYKYDQQISQYYDDRYQQGAGEISDWLNALNTETNSKISLINNRYKLIQYENMLYKAMAGRYHVQ
ncbi:toxin/drug exporter TdeA [Entomomonas asaccharolytica]|uniref:TolC family protein n=1 Tax=Entomomonas asaccharolytica TaxID=2785331 RepID=A0A974NFT1_9GAMM|nr:TolC family protein [Entomomonas asaccharolytica]QQP85763.1 TolC family protein [Entomomonas asaccharolytica]